MSFDELIEAMCARDQYDDFGNLARTIYSNNPDKFYSDFFDKVRQFLKEGGDLHQSFPPMGWSLMHLACEKRDVRLIKGLLEVDRNLLHTSADCNYPPIFQALDSDIDCHIQVGKPITLETTKAMLELGADPDARDQNNLSLREFARSYGTSVVQIFDEIIGLY
ncbi:hypothetical protein Pan241w_09330 [Gimesia alba]|uniref:Ankyrin repeats (3 copies) n=1 Tax=Gimesia alba TaxID=2527973 RepID=A0A517RAF5_9PLAN|nr:ankyrin repeat domain-containing protein [Gimesia alba]QDT40874.1 hypothetical protein Pan241w_09330 [Gimesia alba]